MKKELIRTERYILAVDGNPKDGEYCLDSYGSVLPFPDLSFLGLGYDKETIKKVIAHLPLNNSPILQGVPLLPPIEVEDDIEKEACDHFAFPITIFKEMKRCSQNYFLLSEQFGEDEANGYMSVKHYIRAYNKAREKYKYTDEDLKRAIELAQEMKFVPFTDDEEHTYFPEVVFKMIQQPKTPTHFEFEMYMLNLDELREQGRGFLNAPTSKIKTTPNSQGQTVACGKYLFEL